MLVPKLVLTGIGPAVVAVALLLAVLLVRDWYLRTRFAGYRFAREQYLAGACPFELYDTHQGRGPFQKGVRKFCAGQIALGSRVK